MRAMSFPRLLLILVLLFSATSTFAREPLGKSAPSRKPVDKVQQQKDNRRTALVAVIKAQQKIIDRYEQQSSSTKKPAPKQLVSEEEYEQAKAKKAEAEAELDELRR